MPFMLDSSSDGDTMSIASGPAQRARSETLSSVTSEPFRAAAPFNTPTARSIAGDPVQLARPIDGTRLQTTLDSIEEYHNDAVSLDFSIRPTPPGNTPVHSRAPSLTTRLLPGHPALMRRISATAEAEAEGSIDSAAETVGETIHIAMGSPRSDPQMNGTAMVSRPGSTNSLPAYPGGQGPPAMPETQPGVFEATDWRAAIYEDATQALARLENLANDDHQKDPSRSQRDHYRQHLVDLFSRGDRINPFDAVTVGSRQLLMWEHVRGERDIEMAELRARLDELERLIRDQARGAVL